jgi:hypothetical protein
VDCACFFECATILVTVQIADSISDIACWLALAVGDSEEDLPGAFDYWPELPPVLWQAASSDQPGCRECALRILGDVPQIFGNRVGDYIHEIKALLGSSVRSPQGTSALTTAAAKTITAFILVCCAA